MASSTSSFFFKLENSTLTIQDIRDFGLVAQEGKNGFVEVSISDAILNSQRDLKHVQSGASSLDMNFNYIDWDAHFKGAVKFLIDGLKPNTPPLMHLNSDSFGGCMDDYPRIKVYQDENTSSKYKDNYKKDSEAETIFLKYYPECSDGYYDSVGFVRHSSSDLISKEQKQAIKDIEIKIEEIEFNRWIEKQDSLTLEVLSSKLIEAFETVTAWRCNDTDKTKAVQEVNFIKKYIAMYH